MDVLNQEWAPIYSLLNIYETFDEKVARDMCNQFIGLLRCKYYIVEKGVIAGDKSTADCCYMESWNNGCMTSITEQNGWYFVRHKKMIRKDNDTTSFWR